MIKPTNELVEWMETFDPQSKLAQLLDITPEVLSRVKNSKQSASRNMMEAMCNLNGWPLSKAWEIIDDVEKD